MTEGIISRFVKLKFWCRKYECEKCKAMTNDPLGHAQWHLDPEHPPDPADRRNRLDIFIVP